MPLLAPMPEPVRFEEVAAVLDAAAVRAPGGPPTAICAAGWHLAGALDQAGLTVVRMPAPGAQLTLQMPDGVHQNGRSEKLERLPIGDLSAWHLMVTCPACPPMPPERAVLVRYLVARFGPDQRLAFLVHRLVCKQGGRRAPSRIVLRSRLPIDEARFLCRASST